MRQTYLMISLVLIVVLAAHFRKIARANAALAENMNDPQRTSTVASADDDDRDDRPIPAAGHLAYVDGNGD